MNELDLKLFLAKMVPELIQYDHGTGFFLWRGPKDTVTPHEWLAVAVECEKKLTWDERAKQIDNLERQFGAGHYTDAYFATWQQHALALRKTKGIEV